MPDASSIDDLVFRVDLAVVVFEVRDHLGIAGVSLFGSPEAGSSFGCSRGAGLFWGME